jgi:hypothetical protein
MNARHSKCRSVTGCVFGFLVFLRRRMQGVGGRGGCEHLVQGGWVFCGFRLEGSCVCVRLSLFVSRRGGGREGRWNGGVEVRSHVLAREFRSPRRGSPRKWHPPQPSPKSLARGAGTGPAAATAPLHLHLAATAPLLLLLLHRPCRGSAVARDIAVWGCPHAAAAAAAAPSHSSHQLVDLSGQLAGCNV